ncbi:hypothetical protein [Bradyrhizobium sp. CCBAU 21360]|uniref:hypothetical protein n=1 Tax=Bradyrhizobium sp. CCBAU 21360 TaxID=1325081 RepID=UPI002305F112|nr:hypothetical protein [Bradyrhizobium sp. CCBAU 21360]MDA9447904.1 hypothetical protein [Bradyrhizobium sp. CCBAU 21360]
MTATLVFLSHLSRFKMLNVVKFRRPGAPMRRTESMQTMAIAKRDAPLAPFAIACDSGQGANQRLKAARANAKLTIAHAIAPLEENHRQIRALIHKMADSSAGARLEADLDLIERELALAKRKSASL